MARLPKRPGQSRPVTATVATLVLAIYGLGGLAQAWRPGNERHWEEGPLQERPLWKWCP